MFGGAELDLRDAELTDRPARVNVLALFGGAEVVVPRDWNVKMDVLPILAGASDDRPRRESEHDEIDLVVTGFTAFGGVSVTD
ncbi:cell wall-active antibiotics response protein [Halogeometricum sp. CBA1124]|uniref:cell wall-active antibiotics response protein n=1 Tax=Halogeometricum sp. CBA1124 TaxID=2668071 RepID=UPI001E386B97|nr:cell wall-active antibiotics response protein [Halogeometricum sp. CBA1124]